MAIKRPDAKKKLPPKEKPKMSSDHFTLYRHPAFYALLELDKNEKKKVKFVQQIEQFVRSSREYRSFLGYLKREASLTYCSVMGNLQEDALEQISLEIHHYPFTLFDITETVLNKYLMEEKGYTRLSIANEVMELHYALRVGLVPLTLTSHQLAHSGNVLIPLEHVFGDYDAFRTEYLPYMSEEAQERFNTHLKRASDRVKVEEMNRRILSVNPALFALPESVPNDALDDEDSPLENEEETEIDEDEIPF
jgi:hypothetical protein